jgi:hypothetical protein
MSTPFTSYVNPGAVLDDKWEEDKDISTDFDSFKTKYGDLVLVKSCISDLNRFFFFVNDTLRGLIEYVPIEDEGILVKETINVGSLGFYMSDIFKNFLLKHFRYILSDSYHTVEGFGVYKRLLKDSEIDFTVVDKNTKAEQKPETEEDLVKYYGKGKSNFIYRIQLK